MEPLNSRDPKMVGDFVLIGRLGSGGMGIVYLASRRSENVALKVIRDHLVEDPAQATRFAREVDTLAAIDSPNVARLVDSGVDDEGRVWFATEFINGPDLDSRVKDRGSLLHDEWWLLAEGLLNALAAAHGVGVVHRDIKPANIILSDSGPKLIDFGIAQVSEATSVTSTGMVAGTPAWFSPEQIEGLPVGPATDVFSAASALVFAANGNTPWGDQTTMTKASVFKILTAEPDLTDLEGAQAELVSAMLEKEAAARPTAGQLLLLLEDIRQGRALAKDLVGDSMAERRSNTTIIPRSEMATPASRARRGSASPGGPVSSDSSSVGDAPRRPIFRNRKILVGLISVVALVISGGVVGGIALSNSTGPIEVRVVDQAGPNNPPIGPFSLEVTSTASGSGDEWDAGESLRILYSPPFSEDESYEQMIDPASLGLTGFSGGLTLIATLTLSADEALIELTLGDGEPVRTIRLDRGNESRAISACVSSLSATYATELAILQSIGTSYLNELSASRLDLLNVPDSDEFLLYTDWASRFSSLSSRVASSVAAIQVRTAALPGEVGSFANGLLSRYSATGQGAQTLSLEYQNLAARNAPSGTEVNFDPLWNAANSLFFDTYPWDGEYFRSMTEAQAGEAMTSQCSNEIN